MWTVTRQHACPDGQRCVAINRGDLDRAGPDMLCPVYEGEGETFYLLSAALSAACEVVRQWRERLPGEPILVSIGERVDPVPLDDDFLAWAEDLIDRFDGRVPRCVGCGDPLGRRKYKSFDLDEEYCSEYCASLDLERLHEFAE